MNGFSIFKQRFAEFFDKDKKTVDEVLERKLKLINDFEADVKDYFRSVDLFSYNAITIMESNQQFSQSLRTLYQGSAFHEYIEEVTSIMEKGSNLSNKVESMNQTLKNLCRSLFKTIKEVKAQQEIREDARVVYDHYRNKVQKLEKTHLNSGEPKKKETYHRNVEKHNKAKAEFDTENSKLDSLLERVQSKSDVLIDQICIRFSCEIEAQFFREMTEIYQQLEEFEQRMREIAKQASQGQLGQGNSQ